ncbi:putative transcription factor WRKY family [Dioscorea sansibarensis]
MAEDRYNWRKYGRKKLRSSENSIGYYICTHPNCTVKKNEEYNADGVVTVRVQGGHKHPKPDQPDRQFSDVLNEEINDDPIHLCDSPQPGIEPNFKRMLVEACATDLKSTSRAMLKPTIVIKTISEVDLLDDGYRWRKYGQKPVKGNPNPRSYSKCTYLGCSVRKHVERSSSDKKVVITTYEGRHNHEVPAAYHS